MAHTRARRAELAKLIPEYYLSDKRLTIPAVADHFNLSNSTIARYLHKSGIEMRNSWSREPAVVDGMKLCRICNQWKDAKLHFYRRHNGRPYTYCKPCDKTRATRVNSVNRKKKRMRQEKFRDAAKRANIEARLLLKDAVSFIKQISDYAPIVNQIEAFFINEKNTLQLLEMI